MSAILYDEQNRPYMMIPGSNKRTYISPVAMGDHSTDIGQGGNILKSGGQWNSAEGRIDRPIKWGNIMSMGVGGLLAAPAIAAIAGAGGGSALAAPIVAGATGTGATTGATATGGLLAAHAVAGSGLIGAVPGLGATGTLAATGTGASAMIPSYLKDAVPTGGDSLKAVGSYLQGRAQSKSDKQKRADDLLMHQQDREDAMRKQISDFLIGQSAQRLNATQLDPYAQAKSLNGANVRRSFAGGWSPSAGFTGQFDMSAMDPSNLANENSKFQTAANDTEAQKKIMDFLNGIGGPNTKVCYDPKDGHQVPCQQTTGGVQ